ncbi:MAG TPA: alpha/beta hydrolase, partial [Candidatus Pullilachnospira intestinigallinarum]|nr:alpha/beta hydrolase [Candidatus Pullilachnospira intestinigallinarum]
YEKGVHGLALCDELTANRPERLAPDNAGWVDLAVRWIRRKQAAPADSR